MRFDLHVVKLDLPALNGALSWHGSRPDLAGGRKRRAKYLDAAKEHCAGLSKTKAKREELGPPWEADESPGCKRAIREITYKVQWCSGNGGDEYLHVKGSREVDEMPI